MKARFFVDPQAVKAGTIEITDKEDIKHLVKVLRLTEGDLIEISDGSQFEYEAKIAYIEQGCITADILDKQNFAREPELSLTLFQGIPKQGKMETIIQKNVELGVKAIVPVFMERTVVSDKGNFRNKLERWQKISDEAVKQCKRGLIPEIWEPMKFRSMLDAIAQFDLILFPYENEEETTIKEVLRGLSTKPKTAAVIIGPEGGFSDEEAEAIRHAGGACVTLGKTTLRTETAGIAAVAMTMYELEL